MPTRKFTLFLFVLFLGKTSKATMNIKFRENSQVGALPLKKIWENLLTNKKDFGEAKLRRDLEQKFAFAYKDQAEGGSSCKKKKQKVGRVGPVHTYMVRGLISVRALGPKSRAQRPWSPCMHGLLPIGHRPYSWKKKKKKG